MDEQTVENFRKLFMSLLKDQNLSSEAGTGLRLNRGDDADIAAANREKLLFLKLRGRDSFFMKKVETALSKIELGTFGLCEECGGNIEEGRLLARPIATKCISCKEEEERAEDHVPYQKKSHTLGRTFNKENVVAISLEGEEISKEKILNFNKQKIKVGLENQY